ncbi:DUF2938 domain-containing protein [Halopseudomonas salegens]|uniref:DUF2938 domain-containing protein n=1 Tax=Halopseudomonas salegens TaxID=1434072 RepID=A0A1H2HE98_9GAMM|nr:DUF2938 domain-containing protein [Halopseudomonas salegens]SDU30164.1 Protein of unknown function [Halopseudomonas salegens]
MTGLLLAALLLGVGATVFMDVVALLQKRLLGIPALNYALVGRWLGHIPGGTLIHKSIGNSSKIRGERILGWIAHYGIGMVFAVTFLALAGQDWLARPTLIPALAFGVTTVLAPFLVLQPGMGAGVAARKTPQPNTARLRSLFAHFSFGLGLWLAGFACSLALQIN